MHKDQGPFTSNFKLFIIHAFLSYSNCMLGSKLSSILLLRFMSQTNKYKAKQYEENVMLRFLNNFKKGWKSANPPSTIILV